MIELVIAALIQISTITATGTVTTSTESTAPATSITTTVDGGTGNWDDNQ